MAKLCTLNRFKGNDSCISVAVLTDLHMHQLSMVIQIYIQFHELWFTDTLIMSYLQILDQLKSKTHALMMSF